MVAGMLMPMRDLKAIYEVLFRDGVMVAKKDKRPQIKHPEIQSVSNLQVIRAMGSLKSRGYVKETFAWRHFYWYLTNDGIVYLRDYLHLPTEIVPASLQRIRKPASSLAVPHRAAWVPTVQGPISFVPKPGRRDQAESLDALAERQGYRHKMMGVGDQERYSDRTPRFRGLPLSADSTRPKPEVEVENQHQPLYRRGAYFNHELMTTEEKVVEKVNLQKPSMIMENPGAPKERRILEAEKKKTPSSVPVQTEALKQDGSQTPLISTSAALIFPVTAVGGTAGAATSKVTSSTKANKQIKNKEKPEIADEKASLNVSEEITHSSPITVLSNVQMKEEESKLAEITISGKGAKTIAKPKPVPTKETVQESFKSFTSFVTPVDTKPADIEDGQLKKEELHQVSGKLIKMKTHVQVKSKNNSDITDKNAIVNKKSNELQLESSSSKPVDFAHVLDGIADITVNQKPVHAEVISPNLTGKSETDEVPFKVTTATPLSTTDVKSTPDTVPVSSPQDRSEVPQPVTETLTEIKMITKQEDISVKGIPHAKKDETVLPEVVSEVSVKQGQETTQSSLSSQNAAVTEAVNDTKQGTEVSSKPKRKKKKSSSEKSKSTNTEELPQSKMEKEKTSQGMSLVGVAKDAIPPTPIITSEPLTMSTSMKTSGGKKTDAKVDDNKKHHQEISKKTDGMPKEDVSLKETKPVAKEASSQLCETPASVDVQEKRTDSSIIQESVSPKGKLKSIPVVELVKSEEVTVKKETVIMQKISQVELMQPSLKPKDKTHLLLSVSQETESEYLVQMEKATGETSKGKKKGKSKRKVKQAAESEAVNTKPATETLLTSNITTLPRDADKDSPAMASELTDTEVPSKMIPERMCSEEVRQAAAVLSEAPTDKGEEELVQLSAEKNKREVPKPETSSNVRSALAESASASPAEAAAAQASPLVKQEEPPRVAQHSASQAAECSTQEKLSVFEASKHKEDKKRDLKEDTPSATATPVAQPDQPHLADAFDSSVPDTNEATMRKKIVVVEEIVEVKQVLSPQASGEQPVPPPVQTEVEEDELDLDVLEEIALERALLSGAAGLKVQGASPETAWDHSLGEPEEKTWPNFIEGLLKS